MDNDFLLSDASHWIGRRHLWEVTHLEPSVRLRHYRTRNHIRFF
jgi:hypothetical protein